MGTSFWEAFWTDFERFREAENLDFRTFFIVFLKSFLKHAWEGQKIKKKGQQNTESANLVPDSGGPGPAGERQREGIKNLGLHNELGLSDTRSVMGSSEYLKAIGLVSRTLRTPSVGGGLKAPKGGHRRLPTLIWACV